MCQDFPARPEFVFKEKQQQQVSMRLNTAICLYRHVFCQTTWDVSFNFLQLNFAGSSWHGISFLEIRVELMA